MGGCLPVPALSYFLTSFLHSDLMQITTTSPAIPTLKPQEIPFDHPQSTCYFDQARKPLVTTRGALASFGLETILHCLAQLQRLAEEHHGID